MYFKAFALSGRRAKCCLYPGRCPGLGAFALSGRVGHCLLFLWRVGHCLLFLWRVEHCLLSFKNYLKIRVVSLSLSNSS
jgi:hypothetical protein